MEVISIEKTQAGHISMMSQGFKSGGSFSNRDNKECQLILEEKINSSILKDDFSSRTDPFIFTSIEPVLLDWSNKTS